MRNIDKTLLALLVVAAAGTIAFERWVSQQDATSHLCQCGDKPDCYPVEYRMHDGRVARGINYDDGKSCLIIERRGTSD